MFFRLHREHAAAGHWTRRPPAEAGLEEASRPRYTFMWVLGWSYKVESPTRGRRACQRHDGMKKGLLSTDFVECP